MLVCTIPFTLTCIGINVHNYMCHCYCSSQSVGGLVSTRSFVASGSRKSRGSAHLIRSASLPHLLPTFFVDHDGSRLHLYGSGALEMLDTPVQHKQEPVQEILFHFIDFEEITDWIPKLAHTYPHISVSWNKLVLHVRSTHTQSVSHMYLHITTKAL